MTWSFLLSVQLMYEKKGGEAIHIIQWPSMRLLQFSQMSDALPRCYFSLFSFPSLCLYSSLDILFPSRSHFIQTCSSSGGVSVKWVLVKDDEDPVKYPQFGWTILVHSGSFILLSVLWVPFSFEPVIFIEDRKRKKQKKIERLVRPRKENKMEKKLSQ